MSFSESVVIVWVAVTVAAPHLAGAWRSGEANSVTDIGLPAGQLDYVRQLARTKQPARSPPPTRHQPSAGSRKLQFSYVRSAGPSALGL